LCVAGNREVDSEALTSMGNITENAGIDSRSCVGTGSRAHCLLGQRPKVRLMSCTVTGSNDEMRQSVGCRTTGATETAVKSRIDLTLSRKNVANSLAV